MTKLRWEKQSDGTSEFAYSGDLDVGMIGLMIDDATWFYRIDGGANMSRIARSRGHVASRNAARSAVNRAWAKWLKAAGLAS